MPAYQEFNAFPYLDGMLLKLMSKGFQRAFNDYSTEQRARAYPSSFALAEIGRQEHSCKWTALHINGDIVKTQGRLKDDGVIQF